MEINFEDNGYQTEFEKFNKLVASLPKNNWIDRESRGQVTEQYNRTWCNDSIGAMRATVAEGECSGLEWQLDAWSMVQVTTSIRLHNTGK